MVPFQTVLEKRGLPEHNNKHRTPGFTLEKTHTCFWGVWVMACGRRVRDARGISGSTCYEWAVLKHEWTPTRGLMHDVALYVNIMHFYCLLQTGVTKLYQEARFLSTLTVCHTFKVFIRLTIGFTGVLPKDRLTGSGFVCVCVWLKMNICTLTPWKFHEKPQMFYAL